MRETDAEIHFPYLSAEGETFVRTRSLNGGPKVRMPKGTSLCPWRPAHDKEFRDAILVEGESDLLAALSALRQAPVKDLWGPPVVALPALFADREAVR